MTKTKFAASGTAAKHHRVGWPEWQLHLRRHIQCAGGAANDVVSFSFRDPTTAVGSLLVAQPAENTAVTDALNVQICEQNNVGTGAIPVGGPQLDFVAIR